MLTPLQSVRLGDGLRLARQVMSNPDSDNPTRVVALTVLAEAYDAATPDELREHEEAMEELSRILATATEAR